jgi:Tol biopolymer transport system component
VKAYTISADGGNPKPLLLEAYSQRVPQWMPGGTSILYGRSTDTEEESDVAAYQVDLQTGRANKVPGTEGMWGPQLSPGGDYLIGAIGPEGNRKLILVEVRTGKRTQLSQHRIDYPTWSADSRFVYFNTLLTTPEAHEAAIFRVSVRDGREEKVTDVKFEVTGIWGTWSGLAPDGSPLVLRARERKDVYALSLSLP